MTLEEMIERFVQVSNGQIVDRTTMMIVQDDLCRDEWRRNFKRSYVDKLCWHPGKPEICEVSGRTALNMWKAPQAMPVPQDWRTFANIFDQHINWIVPIEQRRTFKSWLGHIVQRPFERPATCYLFEGRHGTGRRTLFKMIADAIGADHCAIDTKEDEYETRLSKKLFATGHNVRADNGRVTYWKRTVTEPHRKYDHHYIETNCTRWIFLDVRPFDNHRGIDHSRQLITIETPNAVDPQWCAQWFAGLANVMGNPSFAPSVRHHLATMDLSGFDHTADAPPPPPKPVAPKPRKPRTARQIAFRAFPVAKPRNPVGRPRKVVAGDPVAHDPANFGE